MKDLNLALYRKLYLIRKAEDAVRKDYFDDKMKTPMHMSAGGEAICVGVCQALAPEDQIMGTYRTHGIYLAKTGETEQFFAEMYGKSTGMAKGKAGSMHLTAPQSGLICTSAIVGTTIPVAIGAAFANKQQKNGRMVAVFFGDGAIDEGVFWESLNAACVMQLPVLFVCEDNNLAVHVPGHERHGYRAIHEVVERFDCSVFTSDSTDAEVIHNLAQDALKSIRESKRPAFMHLKYYRYLEHVGVNEDFKQGYRDRSEYEKWRAKDPVETQRAKLLQWCGEDEIRAIEIEIETGIDQSIKKADAAPFAAPRELYEDVLV